MVQFLRFRHGESFQVIDFLKYRTISAVLSAIMLVTFAGVYMYKKSFNYSVDFTGGIQALFSFNKPVSGEKLVQILRCKGLAWFRDLRILPTEYLVRVKKEAKDVGHEAELIGQALTEGLGSDYKLTVLQTDSVGVATGISLRQKSLYSIVISLILILLYIALRFWSFAYAMGAIVSLFHDALAILLLFLLFDKEISMNVIGAILAVLGYSINDTIVIFARIRENVKKMAGSSMYDIINTSITETLSRTILTTFATTLVVISLFLFGGETLRDLSLALLVGIVFGIYSTIFIATPVLYMLYTKKA